VTAGQNNALAGLSLDELKNKGAVQMRASNEVPFADFQFPTPSGKIELYSNALADAGLDPLPGWADVGDDGYSGGEREAEDFPASNSLLLVSAAAHHFVTSSFANQPGLLSREGEPFVEIHPQDAAARKIESGERVIVENGRGWCELRAVITDAVRPGVLASQKGRWSKFSGGRNINWTTPDALGDIAGQSTFHSNRVWIRKAD
jgi:anaerobic selenocysteine-containing dehydrogenase